MSVCTITLFTSARFLRSDSKLRSHLSFRFSRNCSIVTSSSSTKSDFPNSRPSSSAMPACARPTHWKRSKESARGNRKELKEEEREVRSTSGARRLCSLQSAVGVATLTLVQSRLSLVKPHRDLCSTSCSTSSVSQAVGLMQVYINSGMLSLKAHTVSASSSVSSADISEQFHKNAARTHALTCFYLVVCFGNSFSPEARTHIWQTARQMHSTLWIWSVEFWPLSRGIAAFLFLTWHWQCCLVSWGFSLKPEVPITSQHPISLSLKAATWEAQLPDAPLFCQTHTMATCRCVRRVSD